MIACMIDQVFLKFVVREMFQITHALKVMPG